MTCTESRDLFSARVDGALAPAESATLDAHLAGCAECRRELAGFERAVALTRALEPARAPAGFVDRVLAAARPAPWPVRLARRLFVPWPKVPLEAAALLLVAGLAVMLFRGSTEQERLARVETAPPTIQAPAAVQAPARPLEPAAPAGPKAAADRQQPPPIVLDGRREKKESADRPDLAKEQYEPVARLRRDAEPSPPAVAQSTVEAPRQKAVEAQPQLGAAKSQAVPAAAPPPDVTARLRAADVAATERALGELAARLGGRQTGRRLDAAGLVVVELALPRDAWARFVQEAAGLGALSVDRESAERPVLAVAVTVSN
jgi:hypothetical protein